MADPVWILIMFDLPVKTKAERKLATNYRKQLLDAGFTAVQLSVYAKYMLNSSGLRTLIAPLKRNVPVGGEVRVLRLTDTQWGEMFRWFGPEELRVERAPSQLLLFGLDEADATQGFRQSVHKPAVDSAEG